MHPHALLRMLLVVTVACLIGLALSGCGKQQKVAPAKMPQVSKEPSAAAADTADIFKEFYSEDSTKKKAAGKPKKAAQQETFSPSSSSSSGQTEFSPKGRYTVQISCVRSKSFANGMTGKMKDKGYPAYVAEVQNPTPNLSGTFYRVRIGGFNALSTAKSFGENTLVPGGYQYWVDKKSNDNVGMEGYGLGSGSAGSNAATSYDNAPAAAPASSYQPAAPATSSSSYESSNSPYSSPSSSSSSSTASSGSASSPAQPSAATTGASGAASASSSSPSGSPALNSTAPAASAAPASTPSGSATGATSSTTGKSSTGGSTESGWGTDSASKSGW